MLIEIWNRFLVFALYGFLLSTLLACASRTKSPQVITPTTNVVNDYMNMDLVSLREFMKGGVGGLSPQESYALGETLLMSGSPTNASLAYSLLTKINPEHVPCISYFLAEGYFRKGEYQKALGSIDQFLNTAPIRCTQDAVLFQCCPESKYRNARGLKKLIEMNLRFPAPEDISVSIPIHKSLAKAKKSPLVTWNNMLFLLDTGAEHNVWNTQCEVELKSKTDTAATYSGSDSLGELVITHYAEPQVNIFGLTSTSLAGFAMDLSFTAQDYAKAKEKFCGILSPQRLIPSGVMIFDWSGNKIHLCQGQKCRASVEIPVNCPMPMFKGRPYFSMTIQENKERLFLVDTGANSTSVNANYFRKLPELIAIKSQVSSVSKEIHTIKVMKDAKLELCDVQMKVSKFSVRDPDEGWEWRENGKIGMDIMYNSVLALDFGKSMCLFK